ncbi:carbohydrate ABC transporter permease [Parasalinivibrio latis]|uniref:carbohydrate ABC transporter permease n=1 Tax=Parasalinivibrio latis TaxID=2952610 RepID=UPI0030DF8381
MKKSTYYNSLMYGFLIVATVLSVFPFCWMIISSTNTTVDINKGKYTLGDQFFVNLTNLFDRLDVWQVFWNTSKIAILNTVLTLVVCSMAGYAFEVYKSRSRERVFNVLLLVMMIPFPALMIPLFQMFAASGLLDTHMAVILPTIAAIPIIFYFRQCSGAFPRDLIDASRIEGIKEWKIFAYVYLPVMKSTYAAAFVICFMNAWNAFLWQLVVLFSPEKQTFNVVLSGLTSGYYPDYGIIMLGCIISTLPTLVIFFMMQKQFVAGLTGSVK